MVHRLLQGLILSTGLLINIASPADELSIRQWLKQRWYSLISEPVIHKHYPTIARFQVDSVPYTRNMPRIGLNLGGWSTWGAAQYPLNLIKNPGFEGLIDRAIVIVDQADWRGFSDDTTWTKRPDGFWTDASYDIRSGTQAGQRGFLIDSRAQGRNGKPEFLTRNESPAMQPGDVVSLTRINDEELPGHWWFKPANAGQFTVELNDRPFKSPGQRSLGIRPFPNKPASLLSYFDTIGDRAGKLLLMKGTWHLSFWVRSAEPGAKLDIKLQRFGNPQPFLRETIGLKAEWQKVERDFLPQDNGSANTLELSFTVIGNEGKILLDDVSLGPRVDETTDTGAFRPEVLNALRELRPGYLRDWQGQLGETLDNQMAGPYARRESRYRPGEEKAYGYGLRDFLNLCRAIGANPWIVIPTTFGDQEFEKLGLFLANQAKDNHFQEIVLEFGNENWNSLFRPAGIPNARLHGPVARRAFEWIRKGAGPEAPLHFVVNGQQVNPKAALDVLANVENADGLAVAPYFLFKLDQSAAKNPWPLLFDGDGGALAAEYQGTKNLGKTLDVYEVNLHTLSGDADKELRETVTTSVVSGAGLAYKLMEAMELGIKRQCIYEFIQYDAWMNGQNSGLVKLWGVVRDIGATQRVRPTGLAMKLLNSALPGDLHHVRALDEGSGLRILAIRDQDQWSLMAVSSLSEPQQVEVKFPMGTAPIYVNQLKADSLADSNESSENVIIDQKKLVSNDNTARFTLPPFGLAVLTPTLIMPEGRKAD